MKNFGTLGDRYEELYTYENENVINDEYIDCIVIDHKLNDLKIYYHEPEMILGGDHEDGSQVNEIYLSRKLFDAVLNEIQDEKKQLKFLAYKSSFEMFIYDDIENNTCYKIAIDIYSKKLKISSLQYSDDDIFCRDDFIEEDAYFISKIVYNLFLKISERYNFKKI